MPFSSRYGSLLGLALLSYAPPLLAQTAAPAPVPDSIRWRDTKPNASNGLGFIRQADGRTARAYVPTKQLGFQHQVPYLRSNPEVRPFPKPQVVDVEVLHSMTVRSQYYETMRLPGDTHPQIMALRVVSGPVELFGYADGAVPIVPLLGAVTVLSMALNTIPNCIWYVRRNGKLELVERSKFRTQMSAYVEDCPTLKTQIANGTKGYHYADLPAIVVEYNDFLHRQP